MEHRIFAEPRLIMVPLANLNPVANGVRKINGHGIEDLAASIHAEGLLQNLTVIRDPDAPLAGAEEFEGFKVIAGSRRLRALNRLVETKRLPPDYNVPCRLIDDTQALSASLAENAMREQMHPADEFVAFKELVDQGKSIEDISARFGVTPLVVQRRLRLANVSPKIFDLFREDKVTLEQMMVLALSDDHKTQDAAWFKVDADWQRSPHHLRQALTKNELAIKDSQLAKFVGIDAYIGAGGAIRRDLFSDKQDGGYIVDVKLLQQLAASKLDAIAQDVRKEGWSWVEVIPEGLGYEQQAQFSNAPSEGKRKPTDQQRKRIKELTAERAKAEKELKDAPDEDDCTDEQNEALEALQERIDEIGDELTDLDASLETWSPAVLSKAGAFISLARTGAVEITRGLVKGKFKASKDARTAKAETKAKEIAKGAGHSESLVRDLSAHVGFAIAAELIAQPGMAVIALTHKLALDVFYPGDANNPVKIKSDHRELRLAKECGDGSADVARVGAEHKAIKALLPKKSSELFAWLGTKGNEVSRVLAYCVAVSIDAVQFSENSRPSEPLAKALKLNMQPRWSATADSYLSRVSAAQIHAALADAGVSKAELAKFDGLKKSELIPKAQPLLKTWVPKLMRFTQESAK